jgi:hypothetical protein
MLIARLPAATKGLSVRAYSSLQAHDMVCEALA